MRLTDPQRRLLAEVHESSVLYVHRYGRYNATVASLVRKGLLRVVEPDHSPLGRDGYGLTNAGFDALPSAEASQ